MDKPNYYAIIPAKVRYDENISANAKLLFAEISSLCNKSGICNASNKYLADVYNVSTVSISKWVNQLVKCGYIEAIMIYEEDSKEIKNRNIKLLIDMNGETEVTKTEIKSDAIKSDNEIDFPSLLRMFNTITGKGLKVINEKARKQFRARLKDGYTKQDIVKAIKNCFDDDFHKANPKYLTPEFISRPDKFEKYVNSGGNGGSIEDLALRKRIELKKSMGI